MDVAKPISVLVFGAGAIGTYVGGSLSLVGHRVVFLEQASVASHLQKSGLRLDVSIDRQRNAPEPLLVSPSGFKCVDSIADAMRQGHFDVAIFAMKSFDTPTALEQIRPFSNSFPPILCLQNGVDNEPKIAMLLGQDHVIAGTVTCSIVRRAAGDIVLEKARGIGIAGGHLLSDRLVKAFNSASLNAHLFQKAGDMKWSKVLANLPGTATSAIVDMSPAEVFSHPGLYDLEMRMAKEALSVIAAQRCHVVNLPKLPVRALAWALHMPSFLARPAMMKVVGGGRGGKMPSFYIDLHAGRRNSEVEYLHGAVVRYGEKTGIPTPVSRLLMETLLSMVRGEIPIAEFSHQPEKLIGLLSN